jgi:hypothetical protein
MEELMISLIRNTSIANKISKVCSLSQTIIYLSRRAITRANPNLSDKEIKSKYISYHYGEKLAKLYMHQLSEKES